MARRPAIHVVEINPYAPRPFVFSEVALCLRDAIRSAGFEAEHRMNSIAPGALSIVLGALPDNASKIDNLDPARCAIFNFEQLGSTSQIAGPEYRRWLANWIVLDYHAGNVDLLKRENGPAQLAFELPLVPSESLVTTGDEEKTVDVLFYGTMSERREKVLSAIEALGLTVERVAGAYGPELAPAVRRARLVLHVHFYETALFPVARVAQPVMMGVPVVCETSVFSPLNDWSNSGVVFADYAQLAQECHDLLQSPQRMKACADTARRFVAQIDFATPFARVVRAFEGGAQDDELLAEPRLSNEEIEAILAADDAKPPEHASEFHLVRNEPGQGIAGKWYVWIVMAFIVMGAIKLYW